MKEQELLNIVNSFSSKKCSRLAESPFCLCAHQDNGEYGDSPFHTSNHVTKLHDICVGIMLLAIPTSYLFTLRKNNMAHLLNCEIAAKLEQFHLDSDVILARDSVLG
jgi:hypothetical protein